MSSLLMGIAVKPISERESMQELYNELAAARLAVWEEPTHILDVGTGNGQFIQAIKDFLWKRKVKAEVLGVDDYRYFNGMAGEIAQLVSGKVPDGKILFADVKSLGREFNQRFDYVFINAPHISNHIDVLLSSMRLVRETGSIILRYHAGDEEGEHISKMMEAVILDGWVVEKKYMKLPEGENVLSRDCYIITRDSHMKLKKLEFNRVFGARLSANRSA